MTPAQLKELDLDRHARMLGLAAGGGCAVALADLDGSLRWTSPGADTDRFERGLDVVGSSEAGAAPVWVEVASHSLFHAVVDGGAAEASRVAVLFEGPRASEERALIEAALLDGVRSLERELQLVVEANALAEDLGSRYEELNLLYSMDSHLRAFDSGSRATEALLHNLASRLEIDLAAFVLADRPEPIYAVANEESIPNVDLVMTAIRGDLFRFVTTAGEGAVLNLREDPRRQYLLVNMPYRVMACPVVEEGRAAAMLVLLRVPERPEFSNSDHNLGMVIANQTAIMMQNHAMFASLQSFGEQMAGALIAAIEAKDPYTGGHSQRVRDGSVNLGQAIGLSGSTLEDISWGALLHDVGKIGIPDSIICKAGKLSADEYTMIQTHSERSFEIIRHIDNLSRHALDAARFHHERFDGGGYPRGLRGKQIPIEARVISVADTYDALTSSRSYRAARSHASAMEIIREASGTQLDPDVVQIFENLWDRGGDPVPDAPGSGGTGDGGG